MIGVALGFQELAGGKGLVIPRAITGNQTGHVFIPVRSKSLHDSDFNEQE